MDRFCKAANKWEKRVRLFVITEEDKNNSPALRSDQGVRKPTPQAFDWPFAECKVSPLCAAEGVHPSSNLKIGVKARKCTLKVRMTV